ncbi:MAG: MoaD/ThiS family protein [Anaerolineae bacterium]
MSCQVKIPTPLRRHTQGAAQVQVEGNQVGEALAYLLGRFPAIGERLFDSHGQVKSHLIVYVNNEDIRVLNGLDTPLHDGDLMILLPALAGADR